MKAVIFDLFETLVTEWGRPKYLTKDVAIDLDIGYQLLRREWSALGKYAKVEDAYKKVLDNLGFVQEEQLLVEVAQKRTQCKRKCFDTIEPKITNMLSKLKADGYKIGLISNCSPEEIEGLQECNLYTYLDAVVLSYDVGLAKPSSKIYEYCISLLGVDAADCYFVGDGGSDELSGAERAGLMPLRALWFIKHLAENFDECKNYTAFYEPSELVEYICK